MGRGILASHGYDVSLEDVAVVEMQQDVIATELRLIWTQNSLQRGREVFVSSEKYSF